LKASEDAVLDVRTSAHRSCPDRAGNPCSTSPSLPTNRQTVKLTLSSSGRNPKEPICSVRPSKQTKPPTYLFSKTKMSKSVRQNQPGCALSCQRARRTLSPVFRSPSVPCDPSSAPLRCVPLR